MNKTTTASLFDQTSDSAEARREYEAAEAETMTATAAPTKRPRRMYYLQPAAVMAKCRARVRARRNRAAD